MGSDAGNKFIFGFNVTGIELLKTCVNRKMLSFLSTLVSDPLQEPLIAFVSAWDFQRYHIVSSESRT